MIRRTKIVATLGPATDSVDAMTDLISAGTNMVRLNFSHGSHEENEKRVRLVRKCAHKLNCEVGILADLQGPKIRIARFKEGFINLKNGDTFTLDAQLAKDKGTQKVVGIDYEDLPNDVNPGDTLLL